MTTLTAVAQTCSLEETVHSKLVLPEHLDFAGQSHDGILKLSTIDHIAPRSYCPRLHAFELSDGAPKRDLSEHIQTGLKRTLTELPHFSGKVVSVDNPVGGVGIELDGIGAVFSHRDLDFAATPWEHGSFRDLYSAGFPASRLPYEMLMPERLAADVLGERCIYTQLNWIPGGLLLAVLYHHVASDVPGYSNFFDRWARHVRALSMNDSRPSEPPPAEALCRSRLSCGAPNMKLDDHPQWKVAAQAPAVDPPVQVEGVPDDPIEKTMTTSEVFNISEQHLADLKHDIGKGECHVSTNEACASLLWRHVLKARDIDESKHPSTVLSITCNTRPRMGLHPEAVGNACEPNAYTCASTAQIRCGPVRSLSSIILLIRASIKRVDEQAVNRLIGLLNAQPSMTHLTWNCNRWPGPDMLVSNMLNAGWNESDWGPLLGKSAVSRVLRPSSPVVDGRCYILPRPRDRTGVEVMLTYPADVLAKLRADTIFCHYFEPRG